MPEKSDKSHSLDSYKANFCFLTGNLNVFADTPRPFRTQVVFSSPFCGFLTPLLTLSPGRQVSLSHQRPVPTGGKEPDR